MATKSAKLASEYRFATGLTFEKSCFVGRRFQEKLGYAGTPNRESWACTIVPDGSDDYTISLVRGTLDDLTGMFLSASNKLYACTTRDIWMNGSIFAAKAKQSAGWEILDMQGVALKGMAGVDDKNIFCWGTITQFNRLFRYDGRYWLDAPEPPFEITALHAATADVAYAVGPRGEIGRLDSAGWAQVESPVTERLTGVFLAGPDEIYAVGEKGSILQGSSRTWKKIGEGPGALYCVAKFKDVLYVGAGPLGMARRVGQTDRFDLFKPNIHAMDFDCRDELVIAMDNAIVGTRDNQEFTGTAFDSVLERTAGKPLAFWEKGA